MATFGPLAIPDQAWRSGTARVALKSRDMGTVLRIAQQYTGASQHRLANAVGIPQGRLSEILKGTRSVTALDVYDRIADGLTMPDHARLQLGLAPRGQVNPDDLAVGFGEVVDMFRDQSAATDDIRQAASCAQRVQLLAVRGLGLVGFNNALLRTALLRRDPHASVTILLANPDATGASRRSAEVGESAESFASGIRLALARLSELAHPDLTVYLYDTLPIWRIIALDNTLYVSTFAHWEGHESPTYKIANTSGGALYHGFARVLDDVRSRATRAM